MIFILFILFSCSEEKNELVVKRSSIVESVYASGIIKSKGQYTLFPKTNGILKNILVEEGDLIRQNQVLFVIENENSKISSQNAYLLKEFNSFNNQKDKLDDILLQIDLAKSKFKSDSINFSRQKTLWTKKVISDIEFEQAELLYKSSKTQTQSLQKKYNDLKKQLQFSEDQSKKTYELSSNNENDFLLKSDLTGKIYGILKEKGEMVGPQNPLAIIGSDKEFYVELQIDEKDISKIEKNQPLEIKLDSYPNQSFSAQITKIIPILNERTKTFTIEAVFSVQPKILYPNLSLEANIVINKKEKALVIPFNYLTLNEEVVLPDGSKRKVKIGLKNFENVEIIHGLKENDRIILPQ